MIYITHSHSLDFSIESPAHCYLDLETTGLSKIHDTIVCIGIAFKKEDTYQSCHWITETLEEESLLIETFLKEVIRFEKIYTYGGKHFEWPFILQKAEIYGLDTSALTTLHLIDLKSSKRARTLIENDIGFNRSLTTSGRELAKLCKLTLTSSHINYSTLISEHNKEELLSLMAIYHFYKFLDRLNHAKLIDYTFEEVALTFYLSPSYIYPYSFKYQLGHYECLYDASLNQFSLSINALALKLKTYLPPSDYYIVEGSLMHKSLAKLLPASMRTKATKSTCYLEQEGLYLPLKLSNQSLYWEDEQKQIYTLYNQEALSPFLDEILKLGIKKLAQRL